MPTNAVEIRGLTKSFGRFTLGPIDLTVPMGSIYGLIGPNGAGKTTTHHTMTRSSTFVRPRPAGLPGLPAES